MEAFSRFGRRPVAKRFRSIRTEAPRGNPVRVLCLLVALLLMLAACGSGEAEPTATPTATDTPTVEEAATSLPTPAEDVDSDVAGSPEPDAAESESESKTDAVTPTSNGSSAVFVPLEVEETTECEIEPDIDLAGYPDLEGRMGCPTAEASYDAVAINEFGPGPDFDRFMLWFSNEGNIYTLTPDGTWQRYADTWQEGDATFTCNPTDEEPESPPLPRRGFGKVWCEVEGLQDVMGTIMREERLCQHAVTQRFPEGRLLACFEDATIRYFRILDDGVWHVELQ